MSNAVLLSDWRTRLTNQYALVEEVIECAGRAFTVLHPRSADELIDESEFNQDERLPYWAEIWPSARVLAQHIPAPQQPGQRLLELGCGCGYAALVAAHLGYDVLATDYYERACEFTEFNARQNGLKNVGTRLVDWRNLPPDLGKFDVVIAADVLYDRDYDQLMAEVLAATLAPGGQAWLTDPGRHRASNFPAACAKHGLSAELIERIPYNDGVNRPFVDVYRIG